MTTLITVKTFYGGNRYVDSSSFARDLCRIAVLPYYGSQELTAADRGRIQSKKREAVQYGPLLLLFIRLLPQVLHPAF